jgi:hypothetical protein
MGEKVDIITEKQSSGKYQFIWDAEGLPVGVYYCVMKTRSQIQTMKMTKF